LLAELFLVAFGFFVEDFLTAIFFALALRRSVEATSSFASVGAPTFLSSVMSPKVV